MAAYVTYRRAARAAPRRLGVLAGAVLLSLGMAACNKFSGDSTDQKSWARLALEQNSHLQVVAFDSQTNTYTVRIKETGDLRMMRADNDTGELRVINPDEVVGAPPAGVGVSAAANVPRTVIPGPSETRSSEVTAAAATASAGGSSGSAPAAPQEELGRGSSTPQEVAPSANTPQGSDHAVAVGQNAAPSALQPEAAPAAEVPNPNSDVASITPGGRTLESGPGYVIKMASNASLSTRSERQRSLTTTAVAEHRHDPIICQGDRLIQIDNRNLEFDGDAVAAQDGCEIHITNSHISAKGVGVSARAANVHIDNSQIEGDTASIDASKGAQVYASSSRFKGVSRRLDSSSVHDLGGNVWN